MDESRTALPLPAHATVRGAVDLALADLRQLETALHRAEADLAVAGPTNVGEAMERYSALLAREPSGPPSPAPSRIGRTALHPG